MKLFLLLIILSLMVTSCQRTDDIEKYLTYTVQRKDFVNSINAGGYLEAVRTMMVLCPQRGYDMRIIYLTPNGSNVEKGDTVCILECSEMLNKYNEAIKNRELARSDLEKTLAKLKLDNLLIEAQVKNNEASTKIAELDTNNFQFYSPSLKKIAELTLEKSMIEKEKLISRKSFLNTVNEAELKKLKIKIKQKENKVNDLSKKIEQLTLLSPAKGLLQYERLHSTDDLAKVGDIVWGKMPIVKITDATEMQVRMLVNASVYKLLEKGQKIDVSVDAYKDSLLKGVITLKKPGGERIDKKSQVKQFEIFASLNFYNYSLQPGISVSCRVYIDHILDTFVVPVVSVFDEDSIKVVFVKKGKYAKRETVKTCRASNSETIITDGVKQNDILLLTKPSENLVQ